MKHSRFTDSQILSILKQAEGGTLVPKLCREHGISLPTFYKWRSNNGGKDASLMARLKKLEDENRRLKKMYADVTCIYATSKAFAGTKNRFTASIGNLLEIAD